MRGMRAVRKEPMANPRAFAATACGVVAAAVALLALPLQACAQASPDQGYPERTVRIIVPTAAGGSIDTTARVIAAALAERWSKPVVIENRPGAAMIIGAEAAAKSPPDGYTLLIAFAKANPGKLNHASGGTATLLALELFKAMAEVDITNVPFRGGAPAVTGVMSGETQVIFADLATANAGMQSGKLRTLAVTTLKRVPRLPDVPTIDESGVPGYDVATWIGAFAPAGTPKAIVDKIEAAIKQALATPDVQAKLEALSMEVGSGASAELRAVLADDMGKWGRLVKEKNIRIAQ